MFQVTEKLKEGIKILNQLSSSKLNGILARVFSAIGSGQPRVFSEEEETKLSTSLDLSLENTQLLTHTIAYIIQQASYNIVRPNLLAEHLAALEVDDSLSAVIVEYWTSNAKVLVDSLRRRNVVEKQLDSIAWELHVTAATSTLARQTQPLALLQFNISEPSPAEDGSSSSLVMQLNKQQLYDLYKNIEEIQEQLDALR
ncbi:COMM domain containing 10 protein valette isoform X2 [Oratosquilla oratoria]|uniref:COMM domain containing 10 protein valette isoform X1 n=1 Tax=Oratosquilla oratoria TaxID=337810 RepID=UPI003F75801A